MTASAKDPLKVPRQACFGHIKHRKKRKFLEAIIVTGGQVTTAAELAGVTQSTPYSDQWAGDPVFAAGLDLARRMAAETLEAEVIRRAMHGVEEPVGWYQGKAGGMIRRYSDNLLMFKLKGEMPEKYKDRVELRGALANLDVSALPDHLIARIAAGEHPMSVLASSEPAAALPPGQPREEQHEAEEQDSEG